MHGVAPLREGQRELGVAAAGIENLTLDGSVLVDQCRVLGLRLADVPCGRIRVAVGAVPVDHISSSSNVRHNNAPRVYFCSLKGCDS
ncbi:Uncharacterised protein [Mycobacteroides abscessus subsp. abscessus]|nr:Uncharacterised protein [Mycobacteroides abscessus subsp. abscessus]